MKKNFLLLLVALVFGTSAVMASSYGLLINGANQFVGSPTEEPDYQGRTQYVVSCVHLEIGDEVQLIDMSNNTTWMSDIDQYGAFQNFSGGKEDGFITCENAGTYDFYIKLKYEDDLLYVASSETCSSSTTEEDADNDDANNSSKTTSAYTSSVPSAYHGVMLQAFYWDSNQDKLHGNTRWTTLTSLASEINAYYDMVWLPPSAKSSGGVGYLPSQFSNQTSAWGSRAELEKLIQTLHNGGTKVIADIVINHMNNKSSWCDFYEVDFGEYGKFAPKASWICNTDEVNSNSSAGSCKGAATGATDDGYGGEANYGAARDLAHNQANVQEFCSAYAKWMINTMKYDGFRYDYCKGFHNSHINQYNTAAQAPFSVMEYWDGNANVLESRLRDANFNTLTFDFAVKYTTFNNGIAAGNYSGCKGPGLLGKGLGKYSVTFIDNHDTYQRDNNEFGGLGNSMKSSLKAKLLQCNAFMLSMPGVPCVFYPHWKEYKNEINAMILARKAAGVHSESPVSDQCDASGYRATVTGTKGTLILELGNRVSSSQAGYTKAASGTGYAIWVKTSTSAAPTLIVSPGSQTYKTESLKVTMTAVATNGTPTIYYTLDGTNPKNSSTKKKYSSPLTITGTVTLKAYATLSGVDSEVQTHTYTYQAPQVTPITVAFQKPASWSKVYLYSWTDKGSVTEYTGKWPGTQMTKVNASGMYYHQFDASLKEINFIFNNGSGTQSSDLRTDEDVCYGWEASDAKLIDCPGTDVEDVVSPDTPKLDINQPMYNMLGQPVNATYRGIVIQNGNKYLIL